jgi:hypothetical protein
MSVNHEIVYAGYSTLQGPDADHGDKVRVKNNSAVTVTVTWPSGCFDPAPPSTEEVGDGESSSYYTISQSAPTGDYPVKIEPPPPPAVLGDELPETAVPNIHVNG